MEGIYETFKVEIYNSNHYYIQTSPGQYSGLCTYPDAIPTPSEIKTHPTADSATFRIPHITHRSAVTFRTFHPAFYLPHSAFRNSVFYEQPSYNQPHCDAILWFI